MDKSICAMILRAAKTETRRMFLVALEGVTPTTPFEPETFSLAIQVALRSGISKEEIASIAGVNSLTVERWRDEVNVPLSAVRGSLLCALVELAKQKQAAA